MSSSGGRKIVTYGSRKTSATHRVYSDFDALKDEEEASIVNTVPVRTKEHAWRVTSLFAEQAGLLGSADSATPKSARTPLSDRTNRVQDDTTCQKSSIPKVIRKQDKSHESGTRLAEPTDPVEQLLDLAEQGAPMPFDQFLLEERLDSISKIGEASFSEVFVFTSGQQSPVVKIIPLLSSSQESRATDAREMSRIDDVVREATIGLHLSTLSEEGFTKFHKLRIVQGKYPSSLLEQWDVYDRKRLETLGVGSENDRPSKYSEAQLYALFYLDYAGIDLETYPLASWTQSFTVLEQVVRALAAAEKDCEFEHRDLHWGNILVKLDEKGQLISTIIDFTLSRMKKAGKKEPIYHGFHDEHLFRGRGDHQFEVYRSMRECVKDDWRGFFPKTNVMWIQHLVLKLLHDKDLRKPGHRASARTKQKQVDNLAAHLDALSLLHSATTSQFRVYGQSSTDSLNVPLAKEVEIHNLLTRLEAKLKETLGKPEDQLLTRLPELGSAAEVLEWIRRNRKC